MQYDVIVSDVIRDVRDVLGFRKQLDVGRGHVGDLLLRHGDRHVHVDAAQHLVDPRTCRDDDASAAKRSLRRVHLRHKQTSLSPDARSSRAAFTHNALVTARLQRNDTALFDDVSASRLRKLNMCRVCERCVDQTSVLLEQRFSAPINTPLREASHELRGGQTLVPTAGLSDHASSFTVETRRSE